MNARQRVQFARRVIDFFGKSCNQTTLAVWGLAFKSWTDDVRESPAIAAIRMFVECGLRIRAYDPEAMVNARTELGDTVTMCEDEYQALDGADALVVFTDWPQFRTPDFEIILAKLRRKVLFDGRNLYDPRSLAKKGFQYFCIGRPTIGPSQQ